MVNEPAPYWRVRLVVDGALLHLASHSEPRVERDPETGRLVRVEAEWIEDATMADRLGYLAPEHVSAVSWRQAEGKPPVRETPQARQERVTEAIVDYVRAHPGCTWNHVKDKVGGDGHYARARRDDLLGSGVLVNLGEPTAMRLWHRDAVAARREERPR